MIGNSLRTRGNLVDALSSALDHGGHGLSNAPTLLRRLLSEESWRDFETTRGEAVHYEQFADFVVTPPLKGLGTTLDLVRRIVKDDAQTLDLLDQAVQRKPGAQPGSLNVHNIHNRHDEDGSQARRISPSGTSREAGLRRLRKDAPDLHAEVLAGRLSTHAAMVKAGFRRRMVTVPVDTPENTARALRRNLDADELAELARLLAADS